MLETKWIPGLGLRQAGENCGWVKEGFWESLEEAQSRRKPRKSDEFKGKFKTENFNQEYAEFLSALNRPEQKITPIEAGSIINGKVINITKKEIIIDVNHKDFIYVDTKSVQDQRIAENIVVGNDIDVLVTSISDNPYIVRGSVTELLRLSIDGALKDAFSNVTPLEAKVLDIIPAGYMLNLSVNGLTVPAFMPNTLADVNKLATADSIVGDTITVCLETLQQDRGAYVVSRKRYLETLIPAKLKTLKRNKVYEGFVTGTVEFGVFVQFEECLTGMIHKANINEKYQDNFQTAKPGTPIEFYVKEIVRGSNKIILTQILRDSLWDTIKVNQVHKGKVISVKPFGALVSLDDETMGLIQTTYIQKNDIKLVDGQEVEVRVVSVMRDDRKLYLTFADDETFKDRDKRKFDDLKTKFNNVE